MASIRKRGDKWQVVVRKRGVYQSGTFHAKAQATAWANQVETDIEAGLRGQIPNKSFGELLQRYADEVSVTKRGARWERLRIGLICRDPLASVPLAVLAAPDIAAWRDRRLRQVSPASVRREWTLLSHACNIAINEWHWLKTNPTKGVRRPAPTAARTRRISPHELDALLLALGDDYSTATGRVGLALRFAIETAMRAGEIAGLARDNITGSVAHLARTKNGSARDVPLSQEARRILTLLPTPANRSVFDLTVQQIDVLFRKAKARALIEDLHFHDSRGEAITRLARKLDILSLARMVGHRDLRQLQVYYRESAQDMAGRLD